MVGGGSECWVSGLLLSGLLLGGSAEAVALPVVMLSERVLVW